VRCTYREMHAGQPFYKFIEFPFYAAWGGGIFRRVQHILNEYSVSRGGIVDENVGKRADELAASDDRAARYKCGQ